MTSTGQVITAYSRVSPPITSTVRMCLMLPLYRCASRNPANMPPFNFRNTIFLDLRSTRHHNLVVIDRASSGEMNCQEQNNNQTRDGRAMDPFGLVCRHPWSLWLHPKDWSWLAPT
jgi:hypothetical protein